jgi:hypothetical protein
MEPMAVDSESTSSLLSFAPVIAGRLSSYVTEVVIDSGLCILVVVVADGTIAVYNQAAEGLLPAATLSEDVKEITGIQLRTGGKPSVLFSLTAGAVWQWSIQPPRELIR